MADEKQQPSAEPAFIQLAASAFTSIHDQVRVKSDDFERQYANSIAVQFSPWDMSLIFGQIIGSEDGKPIIQETIQITLTREMAKALGGLLAIHLTNYENQMGEIKLPLPGAAEAQSEDETEAEAKPPAK